MLPVSKGWRLLIPVLSMCQNWGPWNKHTSVSFALLPWGNCLAFFLLPSRF